MAILEGPDSLVQIDWTDTTPASDIDLLSLSNEELDRYSLPRRYDPEKTPRAFANWSRALAKPMQSIITGRMTLRAIGPPVAGRMGQIAAMPATSHNWSGCVVRRFGKERIASVQGSWTVPEVSGGRVPGPVAGEWKSSMWVGLDGYLPASRSMPQIGTEQRRLANGVNEYCTWVWWWGLGQPLSLPQHQPVHVEPGQNVYAQVQTISATEARLTLRNLTASTLMSFEVTSLDFGARAYEVEGRTAEWVVEAPTDPLSRRIFTLPNFYVAEFTDCNCVCDDGVTTSELMPATGAGIRMADWDHPAHPGKHVSVPEATGNPAKVRTRYRT
jgi:hypothetical protein